MGLFSGNEEENRKEKLEIARLKRIADSVEGDPYSNLALPEKREMYETLCSRVERLEKQSSDFD